MTMQTSNWVPATEIMFWFLQKKKKNTQYWVNFKILLQDSFPRWLKS